MESHKLILIGGGGHCKSCIDVIEEEGSYTIHGILDISSKIGTRVLGYGIIGSDDDIKRYASSDFGFLITIGQVGSSLIRKTIFEKLCQYSCPVATIVSPRAHVSRHAVIGKGTIVMHGAYLNAEVNIGTNCIINSVSNIDHEVVVGNHCHISTGAVINGNCCIGDSVFIGSHSVLLQGINVHSDVVIGAGSVVLRSIESSGIYIGNPLRKKA